MPIPFDLSRLPVPAAIDPLNFEALQSAFMNRFLDVWEEARALEPSLPEYDVEGLETDPVVIVSQAWSYLRLNDRARVNDGIRALLAPLATGTDLDNVVARLGIQRNIVTPATLTTPAIYETDAQLLTRYLDSFSLAGAGTEGGFKRLARDAWPAMHDIKVNGLLEHGRRGEVDLVIIGPNGELPTDEQMLAVIEAETDPRFHPEAIAVNVQPATRVLYSPNLRITVESGPDKEVVRQEALARVQAAGRDRLRIGAGIPKGLIHGAAYGPGVLSVVDLAPVEIAPHPYRIPVMQNPVVEAA